jgi:hypothetical protein
MASPETSPAVPPAAPVQGAGPADAAAGHAIEAPVQRRGNARWVPLALTLTGRALASPAVAVDLLRVAWRFRARGWWRRFPFLPLPDPAYVRWRMHTAYGDEDAVPPPADVVRYARWIGRQR